MAFTSWTFVLFVAGTAVLYYLLPKRARWVALLVASYGFYLWGGWRTVGYLLLTTLTTYAAGLLLGRLNAAQGEKKRIRRRKKGVVWCVLLVNFGMLFALKYWDFAAGALGLPGLGLVLPLGVSFYIFQSVGYVIDCYRGKYPPQRNPFQFALFTSFFPQMVQGPISRYDQLGPQLLEGHALDARNLKYGLQLALWGYLKKLVIADRAAVVVNAIFGSYRQQGGAVLAAGVLFYCIQLYCDFSGGIDITRGVAKLFGIELIENFKRPIFAVSLADYWRRWHISLGQWLRDYLFYPMALSKPLGRLGKWSRRAVGGKLGKILPTSVATFTIYFVIGIWHGANFRYIAYGFWNGAIITASLLMEGRFQAARERLGIRQESGRWRAFQMVRTAALVFIGRYITRAPRLTAAGWMLLQLFRSPRFSQLWDGTLLTFGLGGGDMLVIFLGVAVLLAAEGYQERGGHIRAALEEKTWFVQWAAILAPLAILLFLGILRGSYIPAGFIYQQY